MVEQITAVTVCVVNYGGQFRVARYHLRRRCDSAVTSLRHSAATSLRHRSDVAATNARRISEMAETSPRRRGGMYSARYTDTAISTVAERGNSEWRVIICDVVATALRHRCDVAPTSLRRRYDTALRRRSDIAATSLRQTRDPLAKSLRRRRDVVAACTALYIYGTDTAISALEKRMRTRKPRPIFLSAAPPQN